MAIGGFIKTSFVDYPGKVAATVFITGCNFFCPFCHNPDLVKGTTEPIDPEKVYTYLKKTANKYIDAVCFSGGEPLLDKELPGYITRAKELGLLVKVDTNGALPDKLHDLQIDYLAMDLKTTPEWYSRLTKLPDIAKQISESVQYLKGQSRYDYEFRTTLAPGLVDEEKMRQIGQIIDGARRWYLQNYQNKATLDPAWAKIKPYNPARAQELLTIAREYVPGAILR